jgi:hypothetical protein
VPDNRFTAVADVMGISLEAKCPNETVFVADPTAQAVGVLTMLQIKNNGKANVVFDFPVDLAFPPLPDCDDGTQPDPVIIRTITSVGATVSVAGAPHSIYTGIDCELPAEFDVDNPPPIGTKYVCGTQVMDH